SCAASTDSSEVREGRLDPGEGARRLPGRRTAWPESLRGSCFREGGERGKPRGECDRRSGSIGEFDTRGGEGRLPTVPPCRGEPGSRSFPFRYPGRPRA